MHFWKKMHKSQNKAFVFYLKWNFIKSDWMFIFIANTDFYCLAFQYFVPTFTLKKNQKNGFSYLQKMHDYESSQYEYNIRT